MDKNSQKRKKYNTGILKKLADKYSVSVRHVRYCLTGDRTGQTADNILKEYKEMLSEINKILEI